MGRFEIATGKVPKEEPKKPIEQVINKKPARRTIIYDNGDRQVIVNRNDEAERPIRIRTDAHPRTTVGEGSSEPRQNNANEAFDTLLDQLLDKKL